MRVYLGADHAGFERKNAIAQDLKIKGYQVIDCGAHSFDPDDDYPAFCIDTAQRVLADEGSLGVVVGGSGNGEQMAANLVDGVRCALAWNIDTARLARQHNNARLIGVGARMHTLSETLAVVNAFLTSEWTKDGRHQRRIDIMNEFARSGHVPERTVSK
ncbi:ribose-5-phosphate isomerase [Rhodococcoides trifolii]|uniref:Ribose-5-phosphate isomerase B n=1 Tax=Rhodococcoides trifolii TaxID=908250 RepID=A0A917CVK0_9NOCA|nr:ribose-5-phosphate isomerase [Rhodococcus trifolii]GGF99717.1 ribose-5-phosphate isomerase [Rhodococcus trifolii]